MDSLRNFFDFASSNINLIFPSVWIILCSLLAPVIFFFLLFTLSSFVSGILFEIFLFVSRAFAFLFHMIFPKIQTPKSVQEKLDYILEKIFFLFRFSYFLLGFYYFISQYWPLLTFTNGLIHNIFLLLIIFSAIYYYYRLNKRIYSNPKYNSKWYPKW